MIGMVVGSLCGIVMVVVQFLKIVQKVRAIEVQIIQFVQDMIAVQVVVLQDYMQLKNKIIIVVKL